MIPRSPRLGQQMQFNQLKRRQFITLLGGAATAWPLAARAQQGERVRRIGVVLPFTEDDPAARAYVGRFLQEMQRLGWTSGPNLRIDVRWAGGDPGNIRRQTADLVALGPDVLLASGSLVVEPLLQAT